MKAVEDVREIVERIRKYPSLVKKVTFEDSRATIIRPKQKSMAVLSRVSSKMMDDIMMMSDTEIKSDSARFKASPAQSLEF